MFLRALTHRQLKSRKLLGSQLWFTNPTVSSLPKTCFLSPICKDLLVGDRKVFSPFKSIRISFLSIEAMANRPFLPLVVATSSLADRVPMGNLIERTHLSEFAWSRARGRMRQYLVS